MIEMKIRLLAEIVKLLCYCMILIMQKLLIPEVTQVESAVATLEQRFPVDDKAWDKLHY